MFTEEFQKGISHGKKSAYYNIKRILRKYSEENCINILEAHEDEIIGDE